MTGLPSPTLLTPRERRELLWFLLGALLLIGAGIGLRDPWPADEPRFVLVARQMIESGNWLFPQRGIELYSDKPPLLFWLIAGAYELLRSWRIAFLLPSLLASLATLALVWDLGRRLWNHRAGLYSAIAVLFVLQFMYQAKRAQIDPLVTCWITLANWGLLLHCLHGPNWRALWLGCFAAGLGVISKGVGVLALLMLLPYAYARLRNWPGVTHTAHSAWRWSLGALAFLAPILAWGGAVLIAAHLHGAPEYAAYVDDLFLRQTAKRYAASWAHVQPFWYFLPVIVFNWFPLSLAYPALLPRWWRDLRAHEPRVMLPLVWALLLLVFFSIPSGKRDVYLMPALPMLALAMAPHWPEILRLRWLRVSAFALALTLGLLMLGVGAWAALGQSSRFQAVLAQRDLADLGAAVWGMFVAIGALFVVAAVILRPRRGVAALLTGLVGLWLVWSLWATPLLDASSSGAAIMQRARSLAGTGTEIGLVAWKEQNLLMAQGPVRDFGFRAPWTTQFERATHWLAEDPAHRRIFMLEQAMREMGACIDASKAVRVGHANRREWWLLGSDALVPGCTPGVKDAGIDDDAEP